MRLTSIPDLAPVSALYKGARASNFHSVEVALDAYGISAGLDRPHRLVHYLAQLAHESGNFRYDSEVWGPTPAQARYDTREDLGNTPAKDGDGEKNKGRTPIMLTGGANYRAFRDWCRDQGFRPPDFAEHPEAVNTDPWEGLAPIWFWTVGNRTRRSLNALADANNIEQITKVINGGLNGYADRLAKYTEIGLVLAGFGPKDVLGFQRAARAHGTYDGALDGDAGPLTRTAIHKTLAALAGAKVTAAPVVEEKPVAVAPAGATKLSLNRTAAVIGAATPLATAFGGFDFNSKVLLVAVAIVAAGFLLWRGEAIAGRVKAILATIDG